MDQVTYLARPGQPLTDHLDGVVAKATTLVSESTSTPRGKSLSQLVATVAHLHDIGKLTPEFQQYIHETPNRPAKKSEYHATTGAFLTYHALAAQGYGPLAATAGLYAVLRHHRTLPDFEDEHRKWRTRPAQYADLGPKLQGIDTYARETVDDRLREASNGTLGWDDIYVDNPQAYQKKLRQISTLENFEEFYPLLQRVWSVLTCADKLDAAGVPLSSTTPRPGQSRFQFETNATGIEQTLNNYRSKAQADVATQLSDLADGSGDVFTLTLPTGFGKTFAGLKAALQYADTVDSRTIYALPYTTILDQVDNDIRTHLGVSPLSEHYTLHHHLADTRTRISNDKGAVSDGDETLYAESWRSGLVLTTFVQLFESLAGPQNTQSMKLPALQNAVIIVDEPQVLPRDWWRLVTQLIDTLADDYNATVILMTATQPRFVDQSSIPLDPDELVPDTQQYFDFLEAHERVCFEIDTSVPVGETAVDSPLLPSEAGARLVEQTQAGGGGTLAIANTVRSATELAVAVREYAQECTLSVLDLGEIVEGYVRSNGDRIIAHLKSDESVEVLADKLFREVQTRISEQDIDLITASLTAALRPCDRTLVIALLSMLLQRDDVVDKCPILVTSTQLVEAGVDLSFDQVYRDFAPLPSLVQAAGRCNRSFESDQGRVVLWRLSSPSHDQLPSKLVYSRGGDRLSPTSAALASVCSAERSIFEIAMITDGVEQYYDVLHEADQRDHHRDELVDAYNRAQGEVLREASLIDDNNSDVLTIRSNAEWQTLQCYLREKSGERYCDGEDSLSILQQLFASVPEDRAVVLDESEQVVSGVVGNVSLDEFAVVDARDCSVYDLQTGSGLRHME